MHVEPQHILAASTLLASQPLVALVAPGKVRRRHNLNTAAAIVQSAGGESAANAHPFWDAGVSGQGQIIGVGDSGLDMDHCAYVDPAVPFEGFSTGSSRTPQFVSKTHRKVALYYMCAPVFPPHFRCLNIHVQC